MKVYIAAPIVWISEKTSEQINNVKAVLSELEAIGKIILHDPSKQKVPNARGMSIQEWGRCIFTLDVLAIDSCDWVVVCDFGRNWTAGTARECGYAFGKGKNVLIIEMYDNGCDYSVMMRWCCSNYCKYTEFISTPVDDKIEKFFYHRGKTQQKENLN